MECRAPATIRNWSQDLFSILAPDHTNLAADLMKNWGVGFHILHKVVTPNWSPGMDGFVREGHGL
jgi:hypothetical protein